MFSGGANFLDDAVAPRRRTHCSDEFYDAYHPTSGSAMLVAREDGRYELCLENFTSDDGPDIFIFLSDAENPATGSAIKNAYNAILGLH